MKNKWKYYRINPNLLSTHPINWSKAYKYAKDMEAGDKFPAVKMGIDKRNGKMVVRNGAHRTVAARMVGKKLLIKTKANLKLEEVKK